MISFKFWIFFCNNMRSKSYSVIHNSKKDECIVFENTKVCVIRIRKLFHGKIHRNSTSCKIVPIIYTFSSPFFHISFSYFSLHSGLPYRIFLLHLLSLPCHFYVVHIEQKRILFLIITGWNFTIKKCFNLKKNSYWSSLFASSVHSFSLNDRW